MTKNYMYITKYSGLPIERTGTDQNTWTKMHASTLSTLPKIHPEFVNRYAQQT